MKRAISQARDVFAGDGPCEVVWVPCHMWTGVTLIAVFCSKGQKKMWVLSEKRETMLQELFPGVAVIVPA